MEINYELKSLNKPKYKHTDYLFNPLNFLMNSQYNLFDLIYSKLFDHEIPNHVNKFDILKIREIPKMILSYLNWKKTCFSSV